jgi:plasmid stabilization system protein ParE
MVKKVEWNKKAIQKLDDITDFLVESSSNKTVEKFVNNVFSKIEVIKIHPEIGRPTKRYKTVRMYKIDKYRNLYYRIHGSVLIIVYFFDTRQNPKQNPYL